MRYEGACHCGAIRFEVEAPEAIEAERCNCSICTKPGFLHLIVPRSNPDGMDVNVHCLDPQPASIRVVDFDGQHWEQNAHKLAHKSRDA